VDKLGLTRENDKEGVEVDNGGKKGGTRDANIEDKREKELCVEGAPY